MVPWAGARPGVPGVGQWVPPCCTQAVAGSVGAACPGQDVWWWHRGGPCKVVQLNQGMEGCSCRHVVACQGTGGAWPHVGQGWRCELAGLGWCHWGWHMSQVGTIGCCHPMACPKLPGGWCRRGQGQAPGAGVQGATRPPRTRVLFTCAPLAAAAQTPDGCPKAPARPPALSTPSRLAGALATLPSRGAGPGAAGAP